MWSRGCVFAACAKSGHFDSQSVDADSEFHFTKSGGCKSKLYTVFTSCPRAQQTFRHVHITGHSVAQDKGASRVKSHHTLSSCSLLCHVDAQHTLCSFSCTTVSLQRLTIQIHNDDHITHEESRPQGGAWPTGQFMPWHWLWAQARRHLRQHGSEALADRKSQRPSEVPVLRQSHRDPCQCWGFAALGSKQQYHNYRSKQCSNVRFWQAPGNSRQCLTENLSRQRFCNSLSKGKKDRANVVHSLNDRDNPQKILYGKLTWPYEVSFSLSLSQQKNKMKLHESQRFQLHQASRWTD